MGLLDQLKNAGSSMLGELQNQVSGTMNAQEKPKATTKKTSKQPKKTASAPAPQSNVSAGLYDQQLEKLIDLALADGELTEKEKQVLFKKAESMGIDLDEFEMVLDARLSEIQKENNAKVTAAAPKSTKLGDVKKCPSCGAIVNAYLGACPECGYAFEGIDSNSTAQNLAEKLEKLSAEWDKKIEIAEKRTNDGRWEVSKEKEQALADAIRTTTIPNTKADLFEFLTMTQASFLSLSTPYYSAEAYMAKYNEALLKAKGLFANDPLFASLISSDENTQKKYNKIHKKQKKVGMNPMIKTLIGVALGFIFTAIFCFGVEFLGQFFES